MPSNSAQLTNADDDVINSGKTSVISLIERFYDVSRGQILFNDKDIYSVNIGEHRKLISLVAQEPNLFRGEFPTRLGAVNSQLLVTPFPSNVMPVSLTRNLQVLSERTSCWV
jgi:ABC-type ATPase involved in cell division